LVGSFGCPPAGLISLICDKVAPEPTILLATGGKALDLPAFFFFSSSLTMVNLRSFAAGAEMSSKLTKLARAESTSVFGGWSSSRFAGAFILSPLVVVGPEFAGGKAPGGVWKLGCGGIPGVIGVDCGFVSEEGPYALRMEECISFCVGALGANGSSTGGTGWCIPNGIEGGADATLAPPLGRSSDVVVLGACGGGKGGAVATEVVGEAKGCAAKAWGCGGGALYCGGGGAYEAGGGA